ncbi:electron transfer flavoprotein beta subunit [Marinitoga hydrogenitolerans DSM 16785]|uniref:Electron transfer flavoprotein beta subunit n=1 Tax=Marinitoga hydrogenitolerans (strain DSM 16785 / JCM 12826 / AT1271) TaxID=1122195 RepID=A0A1M4XG52_MARH1|nr:electron transfer flavoprotein subunit beta/FixA family protein [Marinitoga hydrogenitolerans]SHE92607.1 electron transfer flavoprotein beta subunit [Marinitoga hydrogenitolerans DSM 16785]
MNIIVCIKQVPDTTELKIDPITGTLIRKGVPSIMNYDDKAALEEALKLKDKFNANITVISMGPEQAKEVLEEALAMGADRAILLSDKKFSGSDTWATSNILSEAIKHLDYDLILTGKQAIDGDTAQVGPQIAEKLNIPQVTYVKKISFDNSEFIIEREMDNTIEIIKVTPPVLFTILKEANKPRYMNIKKLVDICSKDNIEVWSNEKLKLDENIIGLKGSPTKVRKTFTPEISKKSIILEGNISEQIDFLINELKEKHLI